MKQAKILLDFQNDEINCPRCQSLSYIKDGKRKDGKQGYKCKKCNKKFIKNNLKSIHSRFELPEQISPQEMKMLDVWDLRVLGKKVTVNGGYSVNFINMYPAWFKQAVKDFIWFQVPTKSTDVIMGHLGYIKDINKFVEANNINLDPSTVSREFVVDLLNFIGSTGISAKTFCNHIAAWKQFFNFCTERNIIPSHNGQLIFDDDYPKRIKTQVKDIPDYVLKQLKSKLLILAKPIALTVEILIETGMRIDEVCKLKFNCIEQDSDGDWWIDCTRSKVFKESRLFISKELAIKIQEQQSFIKKNFKVNFDNLFCTTKHRSCFVQYGSKHQTCLRKELDYFIPINKPILQSTVRGYLKQLAHEHKITDVSGQIYPIWKCHRFRHTHLTDLARKGTGLAHIMQRAGHASPEMAMRYVHLTNDDQKKKMKEVWDNTHFNMEGEIVAPINPDLDTAEMQWIKKGMGMQTTDNGYCTLLWTQTCPHQDLPCKSCGSWVTTLDFLDSHKKELEETDRIIENARQKGYQRQIEKNVSRAEKLKKIISGMEKHQTMRGLGHNEWEEKE